MGYRRSLATPFGVLGSIMSVINFLSPMPTFHQIYKTKSAEGLGKSIPYLFMQLMTMLMTCYGCLRNNGVIIGVNAFGCFIETAYFIVFILYASKKTTTVMLLLGMDVLVLGAALFGVLLPRELGSPPQHEANIIGWTWMGFTLLGFVLPFGLMMKAIYAKNTKEHISVWVASVQMIGSLAWALYGFLLLEADFFIVVPNVVGFCIWAAQIRVYFKYSSPPGEVVPEPAVADLNALGCLELEPIKRGVVEEVAVVIAGRYLVF